MFRVREDNVYALQIRRHGHERVFISRVAIDPSIVISRMIHEACCDKYVYDEISITNRRDVLHRSSVWSGVVSSARGCSLKLTMSGPRRGCDSLTQRQ